MKRKSGNYFVKVTDIWEVALYLEDYKHWYRHGFGPVSPEIFKVVKDEPIELPE